MAEVLALRHLSFDRYEFDVPDAEESLALAISSSRQHPDLSAFLSECGASARCGTPPPVRWRRWPEVSTYLRRFADLEVPVLVECRVSLINDEWDDLELAIVAVSLVVWYHWSTTA